VVGGADAARRVSARAGAARRLRRVGLLAWGLAVAAYALTVVRTGSTPLDVLVVVVGFLRDNPLGALAFVGVYALRPLLLFPATLLTVGAGILYGPLAGVALVVLAANASAVVAFALGRAYGAELAGAALQHPRLRGVSQRLRANAFEAVLTLRFVFTPYDAVNYLSGALRLPLRAFVVATAIGSLPGTLVFVLFGAGLGDVAALEAGRLPTPDVPLLAASAALFVTSLLLARIWRAREARRTAAGAAEAPRDRAGAATGTGATVSERAADDTMEAP
jgi:uncharacterized membrane protein YdjX (TVP38/TMEM64 family)